jgi:hypothetical protein
MGFGARIQVPGFRATGRFDVTALVGRDLARARSVAERVGVATAHASLDDALATGDLDAVSIATPPATHAPLAIAAARAGKHVLCEKPMARTVDEATAMVDATRAAGVVAMVDFEFRFHPARAALGRLIGTALGRPQPSCAWTRFRSTSRPQEPPAWWYDGEAGGGVARRVGVAPDRRDARLARRRGLGHGDGRTARPRLGGRYVFALLGMRSGRARSAPERRGPRSAREPCGFRHRSTAWFDEAWNLWRRPRRRSGDRRSRAT